MTGSEQDEPDDLNGVIAFIGLGILLVAAAVVGLYVFAFIIWYGS